MKTFSLDELPTVKKFANELEICDLLTRQSWVLLGDIPAENETYVFTRKSHILIISKDGKLERGRWDCHNCDTVLIESSAGAFLFHPYILGEGILGLQLEGEEQLALLVNDPLFEKKESDKPADGSSEIACSKSSPAFL